MSEKRATARVGTIATAVVLGGAAFATLASMWLPVVLASWLAILGQPLIDRFAGKLGGQRRAAAAIVTAVFVAVLAPLSFIVISLTSSAVDLANRVVSSENGRAALQSLVTGGDGGTKEVWEGASTVLLLLREHGATAWQVLGRVAGATGAAVVGIFVFLWGSYALLVDGRRAYEWVVTHAPLDSRDVRRLAGAFEETGRGLLIGTGLTAGVQAVVATIAYVALGVPRALVLGMLTFIAALVPSIGTALVWVPVAIAYFLTGQTVRAVILAAIGMFVIGTVDNLLRPVFARYGKLQLPTYLLVLSIFGGLALFGGKGLLLGPLLVRMAIEAIEIAKERGLVETE